MAGAEDTRGGTAEYPVYRRTADGRHHYRIDAPDRFLEVQRIGRRYILHRVEATAYPEQVRVAELIACDGGLVMESNAEEWKRVMACAELGQGSDRPPP